MDDTTTTLPPPPPERPELKIGMTGPAVIELQQILGIARTGFFDIPTDAAVRAYQQARGLDVDGEVGHDTWDALLNPSKPPASPIPAIPSSRIDMGRILQFMADHEDEFHRMLATVLPIWNQMKPNRQITLPAAPAPTPTTGGGIIDLIRKPSFQLGASGLTLAGILHTIGAVDPNLTVLGMIVSAATAVLGPSGTVVATIIMKLARGAVNLSTQPPETK